ncbi:nucleotidyltransferase [Salirhabdus salicampi]|uniref:nucleotidyltransferase n=1 Tax=Salirhabdus salicampi TaxID=476102 RepID=UPI0020C38054|nr:nucleotidyltransferase [Salirhabdus salicampi]MCP8616621.1 nucleotidyltransferase [Salirhabdus salicampi]
MNGCGVIVEYNPFHNGHLYHLQSSLKESKKDCLIAVMSGNFLQRGEPAIIDKWNRAEAALKSGVDIVVELPYVFAVQHADLFAKGAILTLEALQTDVVCFGSEQGVITPFIAAYEQYEAQKHHFQEQVQKGLTYGLSFPESSRQAYETIGLTNEAIDLTQPNNILGFSYVKAIYDYNTNIKPKTIKRTKSGYHDEVIEHDIASATSIRKELLSEQLITNVVRKTIPTETEEALSKYKDMTHLWHDWEAYFPFLQYKVHTASLQELADIHGMDEGLQYRLKKTVGQVTSFHNWMKKLKTRRYTWTRLQRIFVHLLTNTKKSEIQSIQIDKQAPYIRVLGMNKKGREYINERKKSINIPIFTPLQGAHHPYIDIEERAIDSYYLPIKPSVRQTLKQRDIGPPILKNETPSSQ